MELQCPLCHISYESKSSQQLNSTKRYEIPYKFVESSILAGISHNQFQQQSILMGMNYFSKQTFFNINNTLQTSINKFSEDKLIKNRTAVKQRHSIINGKIPLHIIVDARWSNPRGYNSEEGTVTILDAETGKVLWAIHCLRNRSKEIWYRNYKGSARAMEGHGIAIAIHEIEEQGFEIVRFAHDNDASTRKHISNRFPNAIEDLCVGHGAKGFREKIIEASKEEPFQWLVHYEKYVIYEISAYMDMVKLLIVGCLQL